MMVLAGIGYFYLRIGFQIASFTGSNGGAFQIDGAAVGVQNANKTWSLSLPDDHTLRFELRPKDIWSNASWNDATQNNGAERSEISYVSKFSAGSLATLTYQFTLASGPQNSALWLVLTQIHETPSDGPPPFALEMVGERMRVMLRYKQAGMSNFKEVVPWSDPSPIARGRAYDMKYQVKFDPAGKGLLNVWRDGVQIVEYTGPIGFAGQQYYWKLGIYRSPAAEAQTVLFRNISRL
jgi:hypothetical protein